MQIVIQKQTQRMGHSLRLHSCHHKHNVDVDVEAKVNVTCERGFGLIMKHENLATLNIFHVSVVHSCKLSIDRQNILQRTVLGAAPSPI